MLFACTALKNTICCDLDATRFVNVWVFFRKEGISLSTVISFVRINWVPKKNSFVEVFDEDTGQYFAHEMNKTQKTSPKFCYVVWLVVRKVNLINHESKEGIDKSGIDINRIDWLTKKWLKSYTDATSKVMGSNLVCKWICCALLFQACRQSQLKLKSFQNLKLK